MLRVEALGLAVIPDHCGRRVDAAITGYHGGGGLDIFLIR